jgi:hypothetical protein
MLELLLSGELKTTWQENAGLLKSDALSLGEYLPAI